MADLLPNDSAGQATFLGTLSSRINGANFNFVRFDSFGGADVYDYFRFSHPTSLLAITIRLTIPAVSPSANESIVVVLTTETGFADNGFTLAQVGGQYVNDYPTAIISTTYAKDLVVAADQDAIFRVYGFSRKENGEVVQAGADFGYTLEVDIKTEAGAAANQSIVFGNAGPTFNSLYQWQLDNRTLTGQGPIDLFDPSFAVQVIGDYDADGDQDVLLHNPGNGAVYGWHLDGNTIVQRSPVDLADQTYRILGAADFNGDGRSDLLWRTDTGSLDGLQGPGFLYMWQMNGLVDTPKPVGALDPKWHVVGAADFNGDGMADILLRNIGGAPNENGAYFLWQMDGNVITGGGGIERPPTAWKTLGGGDFDGDGKADFAVRNASATSDNGAVWVYLMNGTAIKAQGAAGIADADTWHLQHIGDLSGDGKDDILFRNDAGFFYSWNMDGTTIASEGLLQDAAQWAPPSFQVVTPHWDLV